MAGSPLLAVAPSPTQTVSEIWDNLWHHEPSAKKDDALLDRERRHPRWTLIQRELTAAFGSLQGLRTIELGSGRGDLSVLLAEQGADVTLLDASDRAIGQAKRRFDRLGLSARFTRDDLLGSLRLRRMQYDVALSSGVIEHFRGGERTRAVAAHRAVLRPGGMAVISVPHAWCVPYRLWKCYCEMRRCWPYGQEIPYSRKELTRRAVHVGFRQCHAHGIGLWQSVGDHWGKSVLGRGPDWSGRPSIFDGVMGSTLVLFAHLPRKPGRVSTLDSQTCLQAT